jgi:ABC-type sugar transport system permease subunit
LAGASKRNPVFLERQAIPMPENTAQHQLGRKEISIWRQHWLRQWISGYLFILPNFLGFLIFMFIPIMATVYIGFTNWDLINLPQWIGLLNYQILFKDPVFWESLRKTIQFTLINVPVQSFIALLVALVLNQKLRALNIFRTMYIVPWVCMPVAVALSWNWIYNADFGYLNHILTSLGLSRINWLNSQQYTLLAIIVVNVWQYLGWHIILLLSALQIVPQDLYEAALVDGVSPWTRFWKITLPIISPVFFYDLVVNMINTLQIFDLPFTMTNGGPGNATRVYNLYLYQKGFSFFQMGQASAMGVILFVLIVICTLLIFKYIGSRVNYDLS